ncbi:hypothetical protein Syun_025338 [Stephania yunnanensis]|uniref:Zinc finger, CCHC-type n=1 Tax=Stephania yunnanensis TaxID=152371 RepID=A0AAP0HR65_9MAGN
MASSSNNNPLSLRSILDKDKLSRTNFLDWFRNLRIVFKHECKLYVLDALIPDDPPANATKAVKDVHNKHVNDSTDVACIMLATKVPELQKDMELMEAYDMAVTLKEMFQQQARQERLETVRNLHSCKMTEDASVSPHVLKMKCYVDQLDRLEFPINQELATDLILNSLPESYSQFLMNYNMNNMEKSISKLHLMLKTTKQNIKNPLVMC